MTLTPQNCLQGKNTKKFAYVFCKTPLIVSDGSFDRGGAQQTNFFIIIPTLLHLSAAFFWFQMSFFVWSIDKMKTVDTWNFGEPTRHIKNVIFFRKRSQKHVQTKELAYHIDFHVALWAPCFFTVQSFLLNKFGSSFLSYELK